MEKPEIDKILKDIEFYDHKFYIVEDEHAKMYLQMSYYEPDADNGN